jgi:hypothetical protein
MPLQVFPPVELALTGAAFEPPQLRRAVVTPSGIVFWRRAHDCTVHSRNRARVLLEFKPG